MKTHIYNQKKYRIRNHRLRWCLAEVALLNTYDWKHTHVQETAKKVCKDFGRTPAAIERKVYRLELHKRALRLL